ncbi:MAG TPA: nucleoside deaminase [Burkholderiales bacterium]
MGPDEASGAASASAVEAGWLRQALDLATETARAGGIPFAGLVVQGGRIVGRGVNRVRADHDPTAHAEISAVRDACRRLRTPALPGATLVASAEPCALCLMAAAWSGIGRVIYAAGAEVAAAYGFDYRVPRELIAAIERWPLRLVRVHVAEAESPFRAWSAAAPRGPAP